MKYVYLHISIAHTIEKRAENSYNRKINNKNIMYNFTFNFETVDWQYEMYNDIQKETAWEQKTIINKRI